MAKRRKKRIASRGSVNNTILKTLINGDKYGYEIIKEVEEYSEGKIILKQPSLYSSLSRFEEKGIVSSYWGDSDIGGRRHYYHLTPIGQKYYQKTILKLDDDEDDELDENITEEIKLEKQPIDSNISQANNITITPVDNNSIPAIANFEEKEKNDEIIIPDHQFFTHTPIDNIPTEAQENNIQTHNQPLVNSQENEFESVETKVDSITWQKLSNAVKICNHKCKETPYKKLHYIKPKKSSKVILDSDGIYKLRDNDYVPTEKQYKPVVIDNVVHRKEPKLYGYAEYTNKPTPAQTKELSDEERKIRNENFLNRFNLLTKSKIKQSESIIDDSDVDYRKKLSIFADNEEEKIESKPTQNIVQENNLFNYVDEDKVESIEPIKDSIEEEDKFVDFEPVEFETKAETNKYSEDISNYSTAPITKINMYESKNYKSTSEISYVLINKVKFIFGIILSLLLIAELTTLLFIFKNNNLIYEGDNVLFIVGYSISIILGMCYIIPFIMNPNTRKLNNYKLSFALLYGFLLFLVSIILIYCINTLIGFDLENFQFFAVKIIVPAVLTLNFLILPAIFNKLINCKKFYD